ncbi:hypothetical protein FRB99_008821 [Tulasnella sp. 403]|nr:hypothetical protein FRB99_008821 [Tulasnella sp. 403]
MQEPIIRFTPRQLSFRRPFNGREVQEVLLTNPSPHRLFYKLDFISPSGLSYELSCPMLGYLEPRSSMTVQVTRLPLPEDPLPRYRQDVLTVQGISVNERTCPEEEREWNWALLSLKTVHVYGWLMPMQLLEADAEGNVQDLAEDLASDYDTCVIRPSEMEPTVHWTRFEPMAQGVKDAFFTPKDMAQPIARSRCTIQFGFMKYDDGPQLEPTARGTQELMIWSQLNHRNISPLLGYFLHPTIAFMMPFYDNGTVLDYVMAKQPNYAVRHSLVEDIAEGLAYLHSRNVIHGDLKHDNVMVDNNVRAVLIDFGLSMDLSPGDRSGGLKLTWAGVRDYTAPEVKASSKKTKSSDVFAFGLVALETASGQGAFTGSQHLPSSNKTPNPLAHGYSERNLFWRLVSSCFSPSPGRRIPIHIVIHDLKSKATCDTLRPNFLSRGQPVSTPNRGVVDDVTSTVANRPPSRDPITEPPQTESPKEDTDMTVMKKWRQLVLVVDGGNVKDIREEKRGLNVNFPIKAGLVLAPRPSPLPPTMVYAPLRTPAPGPVAWTGRLANRFSDKVPRRHRRTAKFLCVALVLLSLYTLMKQHSPSLNVELPSTTDIIPPSSARLPPKHPQFASDPRRGRRAAPQRTMQAAALNLNESEELAAIVHFITALKSNAISDVDPNHPVPAELLLDFNMRSGDRAREELDNVVQTTWFEYPVVIFCESRSPKARQLRAIIDSYKLLPLPAVIEVNEREDAHLMRPIIFRLTKHKAFPILVVGGEAYGTFDDVQKAHEDGTLRDALANAGAIIGGSEKKKIKKHIMHMEKE